MIRRPPRSTLFPYTRSSDLVPDREPDAGQHPGGASRLERTLDGGPRRAVRPSRGLLPAVGTAECRDRKSTRLNSSHQIISYAVFCLKKKKKTHMLMTDQ